MIKVQVFQEDKNEEKNYISAFNQYCSMQYFTGTNSNCGIAIYG